MTEASSQESQVQKLVRKAAGGNSESFGRLYDLYSQHVFNFILSRVRHKPTAEDILHTVFLKAWKSLKQYKPRKNVKFSAWLFQIANFTIIDHWRTHKETVPTDALENLAEFAHNPKLYENYSYLWQALSQLPDDYRLVLDLRFTKEFSVKETARVMNKTQVSIRVLQYRAIRALRKILESQGNHETF